jgi:hypothetical protein
VHSTIGSRPQLNSRDSCRRCVKCEGTIQTFPPFGSEKAEAKVAAGVRKQKQKFERKCRRQDDKLGAENRYARNRLKMRPAEFSGYFRKQAA